MSQVLVIGYPLPNVRIDNYTPFTAPSYFDYGALIIDPESITATARGIRISSMVVAICEVIYSCVCKRRA